MESMPKSLLPILLTLLLGYACANTGTLKGGPKDESPPVLDVERSTPNFQTNFEKQRIEFVFDEFIEVKDQFTQVVISPPLEKPWKLSKKLKKVRFDFHEDEVLKKDATYTINFGEAIRDFTEGNVVPNLRFVFSTGNLIDSLELSGQLVNALDGEPAEEVLLMLYDNLSDTVVRTERPFYFARTDKTGQFKIQNVKPDTFKVFALKDADLNYMFNQENELIGFPDSNIILSDTKNTLPEIAVFSERKSMQLLSKEVNNYGLVKLTFNQEPYDVDIRQDDIGTNFFYERELDTIKLWYDTERPSDWQIFLEQDTSFLDTIKVKTLSRSDFLKNAALKLSKPIRERATPLNPGAAIRLSFNHPLQKIDTTLIQVLEDTLQNPVQPSMRIAGRELISEYKWKQGKPYELRFFPGSITDIFGLSNSDTLILKYQVALEKEFGTLSLKVDGLNKDQAYVIYLYFKNSDNLVREFPVTDTELFTEKLTLLPPGKYILRVITDWNGNARWDSGNYDLKLQPEPIFTKNLEELRAAWEVDVEVSVPE